MKIDFHTDTLSGMEAHSLPQSLSARIRSCYEDLSPTDRRLADLMLEYPGDIASYSASELARLTNVSNAAVSRFVQRLGRVHPVSGAGEELPQHPAEGRLVIDNQEVLGHGRAQSKPGARSPRRPRPRNFQGIAKLPPGRPSGAVQVMDPVSGIRIG